jgi:hypothetical protein
MMKVIDIVIEDKNSLFFLLHRTSFFQMFGYKWKWKIHLYDPFLVSSQNWWKFSCFYDLESGSYAIGHHMASFQLDLWL